MKILPLMNRQTSPGQLRLNSVAPFNESDDSGRTSFHGDRGYTVWTKKEELFLTNRGSEDLKNRGFIFCLKCGRIEPKGWHDTKAYLNNRANHPKPFPDHRDQQVCTPFTQLVSLGTRFISDVSLFRFHLGQGVQLLPGSNLARISLTTVAQALATVAADMLEIDRANIGAEFRTAQTSKGSGGSEADVYLYDTTPGGAGFVKAAVADPTWLIEKAVGLLSGCSCESSCYQCLRSYGNRFLHQHLDRELGASLLLHILDRQQRPLLDPEREDRLLNVIARDLTDSGETVSQHDGYLLIHSLGDRLVVLSHSLMPGVPGSSRAARAYASGTTMPHLLTISVSSERCPRQSMLAEPHSDKRQQNRLICHRASSGQRRGAPCTRSRRLISPIPRTITQQSPWISPR